MKSQATTAPERRTTITQASRNRKTNTGQIRSRKRFNINGRSILRASEGQIQLMVVGAITGILWFTSIASIAFSLRMPL